MLTGPSSKHISRVQTTQTRRPAAKVHSQHTKSKVRGNEVANGVANEVPNASEEHRRSLFFVPKVAYYCPKTSRVGPMQNSPENTDKNLTEGNDRLERSREKRPRTQKDGKKKTRRSRDLEFHQGPSSLDPSLYINRELSWLEFNQRVLEEARDHRHPLLERVKFLSIVSSNLDEFFMIRVAAIKEQVVADVVEYSPDGRTPMQQLKAIHERVSRMLSEMSARSGMICTRSCAAAGIHLLKSTSSATRNAGGSRMLFAREIFPVLTPLAFDPGHPFPYISNLSLSLAVVVSRAGRRGTIRPRESARMCCRGSSKSPTAPHDHTFRFVWLEDLIAKIWECCFRG